MATTIAKKITAENHKPGKASDNGHFVVYSKHYNELVDVVKQLEPTDGNLVADTIAEYTSGSGVTCDGVLLKDGAINYKDSSEVTTGANVLTAAESGKVLFLNSATGFAHTLPAPAAGLRFKFIVTTIPTSGNCTVGTNGGDNVIEGMADVNSTLVLAANEDSINFVASTCLIGDWVEVVSDGTSWFVQGQSGATGGITFTAA